MPRLAQQIVRKSNADKWRYEVVQDYDDVPSIREISNELRRLGIPVEGVANPLKINNSDGTERLVFVKAITHLGGNWPGHKKRLQISPGWGEFLRESPSALLIGGYRYNGEFIFVSFGTEQFATRETNNSAAHVHSSDLLNGAEDGKYEKVDSKGNHVTVVNSNNVSELFSTNPELDNWRSNPLSVLEAFAEKIDGIWEGKACYDTMFGAMYSQRKQGEWPGFFLEYSFEGFLSSNPAFETSVKFVRKRKRGEIDLDLIFEQGSFLGDLKCHSVDSGAIIGNDSNNFDKALESHKRIWYVVLEHETEKDADHGFVVTNHWYKLKGKVPSKPYSEGYGRRMKKLVRPLRIVVLEVTPYNKDCIKPFHQGKNSNGKIRKKKIMIDSVDMDNLLIASYSVVRP